MALHPTLSAQQASQTFSKINVGSQHDRRSAHRAQGSLDDGALVYCITRAATTSIFADLPQPSGEITVTTSGGIILSLLPFAGPEQI
jgi:hypothetical protein